MKSHVRTVSMAVLLFTAARGGATPSEGAFEERGRLEFQVVAPESPEEPGMAALPTSPQSVWVNGCQYTLAMVSDTHPALRGLNITREPSPKCEAQTQNLVLPTPDFLQPMWFVLMEKRNQLVVAWLRPIHHMYGVVALSIHHLSAETLETVRSDGFVPYFRSGAILEASLEFQGHRLIVHGTKTGVFTPSEPWGAYPHFTATYPHFLTSNEPPTLVLYE